MKTQNTNRALALADLAALGRVRTSPLIHSQAGN